MRVAGVDEVGRGPLAGPVLACAVILDKNKPIIGLNDSKKLSEKKREQLSLEIRLKAKCYAIGFCSVREIDEINILQASLLAMKRAVEGLKIQPHRVLVDGNRCPELTMDCEAIIGGDSLIPEISAASIIAKVARDRLMAYFHARYPDYGFLKHKGYPTKDHVLALRQFGVLPLHRKTFGPVRSILEIA
jgi:ribonuclease HII